jgi:hypothetical protein
VTRAISSSRSRLRRPPGPGVRARRRRVVRSAGSSSGSTAATAAVAFEPDCAARVDGFRRLGAGSGAASAASAFGSTEASSCSFPPVVAGAPPRVRDRPRPPRRRRLRRAGVVGSPLDSEGVVPASTSAPRVVAGASLAAGRPPPASVVGAVVAARSGAAFAPALGALRRALGLPAFGSAVGAADPSGRTALAGERRRRGVPVGVAAPWGSGAASDAAGSGVAPPWPSGDVPAGREPDRPRPPRRRRLDRGGEAGADSEPGVTSVAPGDAAATAPSGIAAVVLSFVWSFNPSPSPSARRQGKARGRKRRERHGPRNAGRAPAVVRPPIGHAGRACSGPHAPRRFAREHLSPPRSSVRRSGPVPWERRAACQITWLRGSMPPPAAPANRGISPALRTVSGLPARRRRPQGYQRESLLRGRRVSHPGRRA